MKTNDADEIINRIYAILEKSEQYSKGMVTHKGPRPKNIIDIAEYVAFNCDKDTENFKNFKEILSVSSSKKSLATFRISLESKESSSLEVPQPSIESAEVGREGRIQPDEITRLSPEKPKEITESFTESELPENDPIEQSQAPLVDREDVRALESSSESTGLVKEGRVDKPIKEGEVKIDISLILERHNNLITIRIKETPQGFCFAFALKDGVQLLEWDKELGEYMDCIHCWELPQRFGRFDIQLFWGQLSSIEFAEAETEDRIEPNEITRPSPEKSEEIIPTSTESKLPEPHHTTETSESSIEPTVSPEQLEKSMQKNTDEKADGKEENKVIQDDVSFKSSESWEEDMFPENDEDELESDEKMGEEVTEFLEEYLTAPQVIDLFPDNQYELSGARFAKLLKTEGEQKGIYWRLEEKESGKVKFCIGSDEPNFKDQKIVLKAGKIIRPLHSERLEVTKAGYSEFIIIFKPEDRKELGALKEWKIEIEQKEYERDLEAPESSTESTVSCTGEQFKKSIQSDTEKKDPGKEDKKIIQDDVSFQPSESWEEGMSREEPISLIQRPEIYRLPKPYWSWEKSYLQEFPELHKLMEAIVWPTVKKLSNPFLHNRVCAALAYNMSEDLSLGKCKLAVLASLLNNISREEGELLTNPQVFCKISEMVQGLRKRGYLTTSPRFWSDEGILKKTEVGENLIIIHHLIGALKAAEVVETLLGLPEEEIYEIQAAILEHSTGYFYFRDYVDMVAGQDAWEVVFPTPEGLISETAHDADLAAQFIPDSVLHEGSKWKKIARERWGATNIKEEAHIIYYVFSLLLEEPKTKQGEAMILGNWNIIKPKLLKHMGLRCDQDPLKVLGMPKAFERTHSKKYSFAYVDITESSECVCKTATLGEVSHSDTEGKNRIEHKKTGIRFLRKRHGIEFSLQRKSKEVFKRTIVSSGRGAPDNVPPTIEIPKKFLDGEDVSIYLDRDPVTKGLNIGLEGGTAQIKMMLRIQITYKNGEIDQIDVKDTIGSMLFISEEKSNNIVKIALIDKREENV